MYYAGIDLHGRYLIVAVLDREGRLLVERKLPNDPDAVRSFFWSLPSPLQAVMESTGNWHWLYDLLEAEGIDTRLAHPLKVKAIADARLKNDRIDARILAHLLRTNLLPECYVPTPEIRSLRELVRFRAALVRMQTSIKNRLRALLAKRNLQLETGSLGSPAAWAELRALPLSEDALQEVEHSLAVLQELIQRIRALNREIRKRVQQDDQASLLMSIPGVGFYLALLIMAEIGEIDRFPSARKLSSYAGLVPTTRSSGGRTYHGRITRQGSRWLRWAMVEAVMHTIRGPGPIRAFYRRHLHRKGRRIARVAAARKLLTHVYWVLKNQEPYDAMLRRLQATGVSS